MSVDSVAQNFIKNNSFYLIINLCMVNHTCLFNN